MRFLIAALFLSTALSTAIAADASPPRVVADIAPVHSLVAMVMGDRGAPVLLLPAGRSPHGYALKPSQARALQEADVVVRVGGSLTPWLSSALRSVAARDLVLLEAAGTRRLAFREGVAFGEAVHSQTQTHTHGHTDGHDESEEGVDPHAWLDPDNAVAWLAAIAEALSALDPAGADNYARNADVARADIESLSGVIASLVSPVRDEPFLVYHDAFHYFEARFDIEAVGSVARGDAASPGARRLRAVQKLAQTGSVACLFTEPQLAPSAASTVAQGTGLRLATIDPLGQDLALGATLYPAMMRALATSMVRCLVASRLEKKASR